MSKRKPSLRVIVERRWGGSGAEVDQPPEEGATGRDDLGSEAEGPYEGQEVSLAALGAVCPLVEGRLDVVELIWGEAGL